MAPLFAISCFLLAIFSNGQYFISFRKKYLYYIPVLAWLILIISSDSIGFYRGYNPLQLTFVYYILPPLFFYLGVQFFSKKRIVIILTSIFLLYFNYVYLFPNAFAFFTTNEAPPTKEFPEIDLINKQSQIITLKKDKIIVLDFWSTFCGVCYDKFPEFEALYQNYKHNPNIAFYAIHVSYKNDKFENVIKLLDEYNYQFPKIYALDSEEIKTKLGVKLFPSLMIIKNGEIVYKGALITDRNVIFDNTISRIESLLKE
tara:strand:- start:142 stop:915 length:774 start_codon:yes stop_codon:yes gene_type:complete